MAAGMMDREEIVQTAMGVDLHRYLRVPETPERRPAVLVLILTFTLGVLVGLLARSLKWAAITAMSLSYGMAWSGFVLFGVFDTMRNGQPNLGSAVFVGILGILLSLPACAGCAVALLGREISGPGIRAPRR